MELSNTAVSKRVFAKDKRKQMDRLSRESTEAIKEGISYGQLKARQFSAGLSEPPQPPTPSPAPPVLDPGAKVELVCVICGQKFMAYHRARKYCSPECKSRNERNKCRERQGLPVYPYMPKICLICGQEIMDRPGATKYCSTACYDKSRKIRYIKRMQEAQKHGTD